MERIFLDTNIVVYANDNRDKIKQEKAVNVISNLMKNGYGVISTQVLQEYAYTALKKLKQDYSIVLRQIKILEIFQIIKQSPAMIHRAIEIMQFYKIGFWDACIISNAEFGNCSLILSENFNSGQYYSGLKIVNPFL